MEIRQYKKEDRESVRKICSETGFVGNRIERVFADRELWADALTSYYTDWEPESIYILENDQGKVVGYVFGCMDSRMELLFIRSLSLKFVLRLLSKYLFYDKNSRKFARYLLFHSRFEVPQCPRHFAHFHINILEPYRNQKDGTKLMLAFLKHLQDNNIKGVYCQTFDYEGAKAINFFKKFGMREYDRVKSKMWSGYVKGDCDLVTLVYEFGE